ncbi:MAG: FKBP-type peptidyl-prolyl cis-trans isomerase [Prevotellaceae bacterium]|jgi:FKBP-type peptidyl-prolyl cis-trans isomerase|nr:FKBP-type peptidyl-prolyl cis-trans isomerase [Prevotellaceae bacterium]
MNNFKLVMKNISVYAVFFLLAVACNHSGDDSEHVAYIDKNRLMNINKYLANKDLDIMRHFVKRKSWNMIFSGEGYFYEILDEGEQPEITDKKQVTCDCRISLLNGTLCYNIKNKVFVVGGSDEIYGLHQAVKFLGNGGKARFIFPSHIAYGIRGDFDKIPPRAILLYSVHVTDVR